MKKTWHQLTFQGGMVEAERQDSQYEEGDLKWQVPQAASVLYIENFNPNIVIGSLTKRQGASLLKEAYYPKESGLPVIWTPEYDQQEFPPIRGTVDFFSTLPATDRGVYSLGTEQEKCTILGVMNVPYNKPVSQEILLHFIRSVESVTVESFPRQRNKTRVVSYSKQITSTHPSTTIAVNNSPVYREPHLRWEGSAGDVTTPSAAPFPGWDVLGVMSDAARHGGSVVFVTDLPEILVPINDRRYSLPWDVGMYPAYVWTYWEIYRKREDGRQWWNSRDAASAVPIYPTITSASNPNKELAIFKVRYPSLYVTRNPIASFKPYFSPVESFTNGALEDAADVKLAWPQMHNPWNDPLSADYRPGQLAEVSIVEAPARKFSTAFVANTINLDVAREYVYSNKDIVWVETIEELREYSNEPMPTGYNGTMSDGLDANGVGGDVTWIVGSKRIRYGNEERSGIVTHMGPVRYYSASETQDVNPHAGNFVLGIRLPNYIENQNPRPWLKGEKIPLVCTAILNGIEIVVATYLHEVARNYYFKNANVWMGRYQRTFNDPAWFTATISSSGQEWAKWQRIRNKQRELSIGDDDFLHVFVLSYKNDTLASPPLITYQDSSIFTTYMWEPFNPSANPPYVWPLSTTSYNNSSPLYSMHNNANPENMGYRAKQSVGNNIYVIMRIPVWAIAQITDIGIEAFRVYVAESDPDRSQLMSIGSFAYTPDVPPTLYGMPRVTDFKDFSKFRLVKEFRIDGNGTPYADATDLASWKDYQGQAISSNGWYLRNTTSPGEEPFYFSCGQNKNGTPNGRITPDFILWDYGTSNPALSLNSSGKYFQGRGARLVTSIKGRTFLGGTIDRYGEEEQGILRYSDVQSGVISLDVFSEEGFLRIGALPHTALEEFREQLWVFNAQEVHRIQMPNIALVETWEYLDKFPGQGTWSPKTVITTPFGVYWCNESGVWGSDGRMPENIAAPILSLYQKVATNTPSPYAAKVDAGNFPVMRGANPYLEISYDEYANELVISSPKATEAELWEGDLSLGLNQTVEDEYRLVYSFQYRTWRAESWKYPEFGAKLSEFNRKGSATL